MWQCPICGGHGVGKVGADQYYCCDCCLEFMRCGDQVSIYQVGEDGTLVSCNADGSIVENTEVENGVI